MKLLFSLPLSLLLACPLFSQVGIGTVTPDSNAILDLHSSSKGLLMPKVQLVSTSLSSPLKSHTSGMIVYNTATSGTVSEGVYYDNGKRWLKIEPDTGVYLFYLADGTLSSNRTLNQEDKTLSFLTKVKNGFSVGNAAFSVDGSTDRVGIGTSSPSEKLDVNGNINLSGALMGNGMAGTAGQVLSSTGAGKAPQWLASTELSGAVSSANYIQGTSVVNIPAGTTADVPGVTFTLTVPTGKVQRVMFNIVGYAMSTTQTTAMQGVFTLLQDGVKISSAYACSGNYANALSNVPSAGSLLKSILLSQGTYTFKVQFSTWYGAARLNNVPTNFNGYNGDTESMLTKMQVFVYNN